MNVLAGGGSFLTLPAMIAAGLTALGANASSTVALFPAQAVTTVLARKDMALPDDAEGVSVKALGAISLVGGFFGALLLLVTPPGLFTEIVPWLILFATGVFARGRQISEGAMGLRLGRRGIYAVQAVVAIYGGYFGGGIGILMLAALTIFGMRDMRAMNSLKILLATLMNVAAVGTFIVAGLVQWPATIVLGVAAVLGGVAGIAANKRVPPGLGTRLRHRGRAGAVRVVLPAIMDRLTVLGRYTDVGRVFIVDRSLVRTGKAMAGLPTLSPRFPSFISRPATVAGRDKSAFLRSEIPPDDERVALLSDHDKVRLPLRESSERGPCRPDFTGLARAKP